MYLDKYLCKDRQFGGVYARDCLYKVKTLSGSAVLLFYLQFNWVMREIFLSPPLRCSCSSGKCLLTNCTNEHSLNPNRLASDFTLSFVVVYSCRASLYFSILFADTVLPFSVFFIPKLACSSGSCSFRYCLKQSGCRLNSAATCAVVSPPFFNRAMASVYLAAVAGLYLRTDDQSTGFPSS